MNRIDPFDLAYLREGTARQRQAFEAIESLGIRRDLADHRPALAGTVPLGIDVETSDLDFLLEAADLGDFYDRVNRFYAGQDQFRSRRYPVRGVDSFVASFRYRDWEFELFAQNVPVVEQFAWLHLLAEAELLAQGGESAREAIVSLKRQGMKTEPAFALHFGLVGDPYEELALLGRNLRQRS